MKAEGGERNDLVTTLQWTYFGWVASLRFRKEKGVNTCLLVLTKVLLGTNYSRKKLAPALAWTGTVSDIAADITNEQQHVPTRSGHWSTVLKKHWGAQQISKSEVTQGSFSIVILWLLK